MTNQIPEITLHDGVQIPAVGFGTYKLKGQQGAQAINTAITNGYRLIDTAYNYENEAATVCFRRDPRRKSGAVRRSVRV